MKTKIAIVLFFGYTLFLLISFGTGVDQGYGSTDIAEDQRKLLFSILNYESRGDGLPPSVVMSEDGKFKHSWRVLLLPFLDQNELFQRYNMDEPWDSPGNIAVAKDLKVPLFSLDQPQHATYKLVTGPNTCFEVSGNLSLKEIANNPVILVEDVQNPVLWTKPEDLNVEQAIAIFDQVNNPNGLLHVSHNSWLFKTKKSQSYVGLLHGQQEFVTPLVDPSEMKHCFFRRDTAESPFDFTVFNDRMPTEYELTTLAWAFLILFPVILLFAACCCFKTVFRKRSVAGKEICRGLPTGSLKVNA